VVWPHAKSVADILPRIFNYDEELARWSATHLVINGSTDTLKEIAHTVMPLLAQVLHLLRALPAALQRWMIHVYLPAQLFTGDIPGLGERETPDIILSQEASLVTILPCPGFLPRTGVSVRFLGKAADHGINIQVNLFKCPSLSLPWARTRFAGQQRDKEQYGLYNGERVAIQLATPQGTLAFDGIVLATTDAYKAPGGNRVYSMDERNEMKAKILSITMTIPVVPVIVPQGRRMTVMHVQKLFEPPSTPSMIYCPQCQDLTINMIRCSCGTDIYCFGIDSKDSLRHFMWTLSDMQRLTDQLPLTTETLTRTLVFSTTRDGYLETPEYTNLLTIISQIDEARVVRISRQGHSARQLHCKVLAMPDWQSQILDPAPPGCHEELLQSCDISKLTASAMTDEIQPIADLFAAMTAGLKVLEGIDRMAGTGRRSKLLIDHPDFVIPKTRRRLELRDLELPECHDPPAEAPFEHEDLPQEATGLEDWPMEVQAFLRHLTHVQRGILLSEPVFLTRLWNCIADPTTLFAVALGDVAVAKAERRISSNWQGLPGSSKTFTLAMVAVTMTLLLGKTVWWTATTNAPLAEASSTISALLQQQEHRAMFRWMAAYEPSQTYAANPLLIDAARSGISHRQFFAQ
jgi:hypothetical protein